MWEELSSLLKWEGTDCCCVGGGVSYSTVDSLGLRCILGARGWSLPRLPPSLSVTLCHGDEWVWLGTVSMVAMVVLASAEQGTLFTLGRREDYDNC